MEPFESTAAEPLRTEENQQDGTVEAPDWKAALAGEEYEQQQEQEPQQQMAITEQPGMAPLSTMDDDPPPMKPLSATTQWLDSNYEEMQAKFGHLPEDEYKQGVKKAFKSLPDYEKKQFKKKAKKDKEIYYDNLEEYLMSHPNYQIDESDRGGLEKRRRKRNAEEMMMEQQEMMAREGPPKKKKRKKKRVRQRHYDDDDGMDFQQEQIPQAEFGSMEDEFQENYDEYEHQQPDPKIQALKTKRKRGLTPDEEEVAKNLLEQVVVNMKKAAADDRDANLRGQPAVEKLKFLKTAIKHLELSHFHEHFIEKCEILDVIRDWLTPLPDGALPNLNIRREMYRIIKLFRLERIEPESLRDHFLMCEQRTETAKQRDSSKNYLLPFGKLLRFLCMNQKETYENRKFIRELILAWARPLTGGVGVPVTSQHSQAVVQRNQVLRSRKRYIDTVKRKRARVPEMPWFDFSINARKNTEPEEISKENPHLAMKRESIARTFRNLSKKKTQNNFIKASVSGKVRFK